MNRRSVTKQKLVRDEVPPKENVVRKRKKSKKMLQENKREQLLRESKRKKMLREHKHEVIKRKRIDRQKLVPNGVLHNRNDVRKSVTRKHSVRKKSVRKKSDAWHRKLRCLQECADTETRTDGVTGMATG